MTRTRATDTKNLPNGEDLKSRGDRGDTLIEVLMSLLVLSITALAIMIAFSTSISASQEHRDLATANIVLASASQQALSQIEQNQSLFACKAANQSNETNLVLDSVSITPTQNYGNYSATVSNVEFWNGSQFVSSCVGLAANPPLEVTVEAYGNNQKYYNQFVVDLPPGNSGSSNDQSNGVISQLVFTSAPGNNATGSTGVPFSPQPVVSALDDTGAIVGNSKPLITLAIESGPTLTGLSGCSPNDPNGVATYSGCTITGPAGTYVLNASWGGVQSDPSGIGQNYNQYNPIANTNGFWQTSPNWYSTTITVVIAGAPDKVNFTTAPKGGVSGGTLSQQPTIQIQQNGTRDTNQNGPVTLNLSGGSLTGCTSTNGTVTTSNQGQTITAPVVAGAVTLANCKFSGAIFYNATASPAGPDPTTYTIAASFPNAVSAAAQIAVTGPGAVSQLQFVTQPSGVSNGLATATWPQPFAVEVEDAFGNPVYTINNPAITVAFDPTDAVTETLKNCTQSTVNDTATITFNGCNGTAYGGGLKLKASYGNPAITQDSQTFSISQKAASLEFTTSPVASQSGSAFATQPVVEILDAAGNIDTGFTGSITLTPSGGTLSDCTGQTPNNGVATFTACLFAGNPGTSYTLTATSGTLTSATSAPFSPSQAGAATQMQFTTQPVAGAVAGSVMSTQPVVRIEDSQGNVVTSSSATISLTSSGGTLANCANLTAVAGVVNVSDCTFGGTIGQTYTLTASSGGLTSAQSLPFASNSVAGTESGVLVTANPTSVPASNVTNTQLTFQVVDNWGNPTVSDGNTVLTVSSTSSNGFFGAATGQAGPLGASDTVTIQSGQPTATVFYGDESVGTPTINALDSGTARAFGSTTLTITPNSATQLVYTAVPTSPVTAGTQFNVSVTEEDQFNNIVSTDSATTVMLSASNGSSNGGFSCSGSTSVVANDGVATFSNCSFTSASTNAYTLTASATGLTSATTSLTVRAGAASKIVIWSGNNQSTKISTAFAQPLSVLVTDSSGNPVAGATVTFTVPNNGADGKFTAAGSGACGAGTAKPTCTAVTNASGIATSSTLTATATAGTFAPTATAAGATANFSETNTNGTLAFLTSDQTFTTNNGTTSGSVIIQAQDGNGNPVIQTTALTVNLTYTKTGTLVLTTDPATVMIPAGSSNVAFTVAASSVTGNATFSIAAAATGYTGATQNPETLRAGATTSGTISAIATVTATSAAPNVNIPVKINNATGGTLYYSIVNVSGLVGGESATPSATCQRVTNGNSVTITEAVKTSTANRPSGSYTLDFVVESYSTDTIGCGGTETYFQGDGTLNETLSAATLAVNGGYGQSTANGTTFGAPLSVVVTDGNGSPVSGALVTFTSPTVGASGTFLALTNGGTCAPVGTPGAIAVNSCTATTNVNGVASTLSFTANTVTGAFAAQASTPGTAPASVSFEEENQ